eukprot:g73131.t1
MFQASVWFYIFCFLLPLVPLLWVFSSYLLPLLPTTRTFASRFPPSAPEARQSYQGWVKSKLPPPPLTSPASPLFPSPLPRSSWQRLYWRVELGGALAAYKEEEQLLQEFPLKTLQKIRVEVSRVNPPSLKLFFEATGTGHGSSHSRPASLPARARRATRSVSSSLRQRASKLHPKRRVSASKSGSESKSQNEATRTSTRSQLGSPRFSSPSRPSIVTAFDQPARPPPSQNKRTILLNSPLRSPSLRSPSLRSSSLSRLSLPASVPVKRSISSPGVRELPSPVNGLQTIGEVSADGDLSLLGLEPLDATPNSSPSSDCSSSPSGTRSTGFSAAPFLLCVVLQPASSGELKCWTELFERAVEANRTRSLVAGQEGDEAEQGEGVPRQSPRQRRQRSLSGSEYLNSSSRSRQGTGRAQRGWNSLLETWKRKQGWVAQKRAGNAPSSPSQQGRSLRASTLRGKIIIESHAETARSSPYPGTEPSVAEEEKESDLEKLLGYNVDWQSSQEPALLEEFLRRAGFERASAVTQMTMLRFLRGRDGNVEHALDYLQPYLKWRRERGVDEMKTACPHMPLEHLLRQNMFFAFHGTDKMGRPIYIERTGMTRPDLAQWMSVGQLEEVHTYFMEDLVFARLEEASQRRGSRVEGVFLMDCKGLGASSRALLKFIRASIKIDQSFYPETLGIMYMINCPWIFPSIWALLRPLLHPESAEKIVVLGSDYQQELLQAVSAASLPREYGGLCECAAPSCVPSPFAFNPGKLSLMPHQCKVLELPWPPTRSMMQEVLETWGISGQRSETSSYEDQVEWRWDLSASSEAHVHVVWIPEVPGVSDKAREEVKPVVRLLQPGMDPSHKTGVEVVAKRLIEVPLHGRWPPPEYFTRDSRPFNFQSFNAEAESKEARHVPRTQKGILQIRISCEPGSTSRPQWTAAQKQVVQYLTGLHPVRSPHNLSSMHSGALNHQANNKDVEEFEYL